MVIKNIDIRNFRIFESRHFVFNPQMNVVLGDNMSGKTTLLNAIQIALSSYFSALKLIPGTAEFRKNFKESDKPVVASVNNKGVFTKAEQPSITVDADFICSQFNHKTNICTIGDCKSIIWTRSSNRNLQNDTDLLFELVEKIENERRLADETDINSVFPIIVSYGGNRLERNYLAKIKSTQFNFREQRGYRNALNDEYNDFKQAFDWLYKSRYKVEKGQEFEGTYEALINAIMDAVPYVRDIHIDHKNGELEFWIQSENNDTPYPRLYQNLSAGFKVIINIVADIAYRCIMLNGFFGRLAVKETPGVVMIDEVDLFLHPHWQQHVLADLQRAFPNIQFIVTTHSPFIVQSVGSENIIPIDQEGVSAISPYNRGIEEIAVSEMGMRGMLRSKVYRDKQDLATRYFNLVKEGKSGEKETLEVKKQLDNLELEASLFHDPAYESYLKLNRGNL